MSRVLHRTFRQRVFLLVFLACAVLVLVLEGVLYVGLNSWHERNARRLQELLIEQVQNGTETLLLQAEKLAVALSLRDELVGFADEGFPSIDYERFRRTSDLLRIVSTGLVGEFIHSLVVYSPTTDRVLLAEGLSAADFVADNEFIREAALGRSHRQWIMGRSYARGNERVITYTVAVPLTRPEGSTLILNLRESFFRISFDRLSQDFATILAIEDSQHNVYLSDPTFPHATVSRELDRPGSTIVVPVAGETYYTMQIRSPYTGWIYTTYTPVHTVASRPLELVLLALGAAIIFLLISLGVSLYLANAISSPVRKLSESVGRLAFEGLDGSSPLSPPDEKAQSDLADIESGFRALVARNDEYRARFERNREALREKALWDLLLGRSSEADKLLDRLGVTLADGPYRVMLVEYPIEVFESDHVKLTLHASLVAAIDAEPSRGASVVFELSEVKRSVLVLRTDRPSEVERELIALHATLERNLSLPFWIALGQEAPSLDRLPASYLTAERLLAHRHVYPELRTLFPSEAAANGLERAFSRNERMAAEFRRALDGADVVRAKEIVELVLHNTRDLPAYYHREAQLAEFSGILLRYMVSHPEADRLFDRTGDPWRTYSAIAEPAQLARWFSTCLDAVDEVCEERSGGSARQHARLCEEYLREHFRDSLGIQDVADHVGITAPYLSTVFHQTTGKTFSQFLLEIRMEEACRLLVETDHTIDAIAHDSGFQNKQSIFRAFRKVLGTTPSAYRIDHAKRARSN